MPQGSACLLQVEALGSGIGVRCAVLVGGIDMMAQVGFRVLLRG